MPSTFRLTYLVKSDSRRFFMDSLPFAKKKRPAHSFQDLLECVQALDCPTRWQDNGGIFGCRVSITRFLAEGKRKA